MNSDAPHSERDPVDELAEQYLRRRRRGERPTPAEYAARYPEHAARILELFPALDLIEGLKPAPEDDEVISRPAEEGTGRGPNAVAGHPGRLGDYQIVRELGRGGMGVVYEAEHESLKNRVALKVMHLGFRADRTHLRRFQTEARSAARLHHTNIVPVFDYGEHDGVCYFAMQYIAGVGLDRVLTDVRRLRAAAKGGAASGTSVPGNEAASEAVADPLPVVTRGLLTGRFATGPTASTVDGSGVTATLVIDGPTPGAPEGALPAAAGTGSAPTGSSAKDGSGSSLIAAQSEMAYFREVARLGAQVADALDYAHRQGVVHRDIKPSNLLLDAQGNSWVADFGLAKLVEGEDLSQSHDLVGTLRFMAPERFQGVTDPRGDIYSLGATMYELLTLQPAFGEHDQARLIDQVTHVPPKPPRQHDRRIPRDLETLVLKALAKDPKDRFATAGELGGELRRYLESRPIRSRPVGPAERLWRWCRRNPAVASLLGVVAAALVAVAVISVVHAREVTGLANNLKKSLAESTRLLASRNFDRGQAAFEKGEIGPGLLWMIESWRSAVAADDLAWQHVARANLSAWRPHYGRLKAVLSHPRPVIAASFSPDGRTVISGSEDGTARLWDAETGKSIGLPLRHGELVIAVAFSPDGKSVLTGSDDHSARLWDATTGEPIGPALIPQCEVIAMAFHAGRKLVLTGSRDSSARLWDAATGQPAGRPLKHEGPVVAVAFSPDGRTIFTHSEDGTARLWNASSLETICSVLQSQDTSRSDRAFLPGHGQVTFSPDGKMALIGLRLWDPVTGHPIGSPLPDPAALGVVAFSNDSKSVLTVNRVGEVTARLWDTATGKPFGLPMQHQSSVVAVAFSPDGRTILTGSRDKEARLWDAATGQLIGLLEHQGPVEAVAFSSDGKTILTASEDTTVRLWDADPGQPDGEVLEIPSTDYVGTMSRDGKVFCSLAKERNHQRYARLWDATTCQPKGAPLPQPGGNELVALSPDGKILFTREADFTCRLWDTTSGNHLGPPFSVPGQASSVEFSPDGRTLLFTSNRNHTAWICDATTGTLQGRIPVQHGEVDASAFSPDSKTFATGLASAQVQLWDAETFIPLGDPIPHPGAVATLKFSPDGKSILISGEDCTARLWDLATRKPLLPPLRHQGLGYGLALAFSPDGKTIATGNSSTVRLWDSSTSQPIGPSFHHPVPFSAVRFVDDGKALSVSGGSSNVVRRFAVSPLLPDDLERMATWVEVITGLNLDKEQGLIQVLDNAAWLQRHDRLERLGGPPETGLEQTLDPIHFGADPTARARAFMERKQWDAAEAAFDEAARARPFNISIVVERGDLYANRGLWTEAAVYYARTVKQYPDVAPLHEQLAITRLLAGDLPGYRAACAGMLERFKPIDDSTADIRVAYACSLAPDAVTDLPALIEVSERSTRWVTINNRAVGAVLFRAGRLEEALHRFEQAQKNSSPRAWDWLFLAMIHSGLGHPSEARRCLQQADQWVDQADKAPPGAESDGPRWSSLTEKPTTRLLRREAEAVIRCDSIFPADPFAG